MFHASQTSELMLSTSLQGQGHGLARVHGRVCTERVPTMLTPFCHLLACSPSCAKDDWSRHRSACNALRRMKRGQASVQAVWNLKQTPQQVS